MRRDDLAYQRKGLALVELGAGQDLQHCWPGGCQWVHERRAKVLGKIDGEGDAVLLRLWRIVFQEVCVEEGEHHECVHDGKRANVLRYPRLVREVRREVPPVRDLVHVLKRAEHDVRDSRLHGGVRQTATELVLLRAVRRGGRSHQEGARRAGEGGAPLVVVPRRKRGCDDLGAHARKTLRLPGGGAASQGSHPQAPAAQRRLDNATPLFAGTAGDGDNRLVGCHDALLGRQR